MARLNRHSRQQGAALLTAMIIVTLISSIAAAMVWRQYRAVQIEAAERARAQASWVLFGSLNWARLILREDARANTNSDVDHLGEVWAVPLAEARLSTFLALDTSNTDAGPEAFLSGSIADAQARYNLHNLVDGVKVSALEQRTLTRLCETAGVAQGTALQLISFLRAAFPSTTTTSDSSSTNSTSTVPLKPHTLDQLTWLGISTTTIERLRPYVTLLPKTTPVNLNTASREVIAALFDNMDLASAERLVQVRKASPLTTIQAAKDYLPSTAEISSERVSVSSTYFYVRGKLRLDERTLEERSLIRRDSLDMVVVSRQRLSTTDETSK